MAIFRCKMCGGDLEIESDVTVCECEYCGSKQTIPTADNEKKMKLFERANRLRFNCEFDKAAAVYEGIVSEFPEEAEGYWGNLLCAYGIEYVDDPITGNKIPTCHRSSFNCFLDEEDYEHVMENADAVSRGVYREQAKQIEEIRKNIIEVSGKEQPYDIFICYKETAEDGQRTIDSVLAQDAHDALVAKGYRVFFSRISLEDKLGTEYEPYIFAALNSAKVMLAFGTSYDYYNAVWVKNEWSRYLKLMAMDKSKHLIPCYKGIDAYDMPKEFARLQAQDMGKVGAIQDLVRGVEKLLGKTESILGVKQQTVIQQIGNSGPKVEALTKRGYDALEDAVFDEARDLFNEALNIDAKSADAYLGLFMVDIKATSQTVAASKYVSENHTENRYWKRARQYASETLADTLDKWESLRNSRIHEEEEAAREAEREVREFEEKRELVKKEIKALKEKLQTGNYEMTADEQAEQVRLNAILKFAEEKLEKANKAYESSHELQEVLRLEGLIALKKKQLGGMSFFKGKEKKELTAQIGILEDSLTEAQKGTEEIQLEITQLQALVQDERRKATEYRILIEGNKIEKLQYQISKLFFQVIRIGDVVTWGRNSYGNEYIDEYMAIEWRVLDSRNGKILLISENAVAYLPYNTEEVSVTWESCTLRNWLNSIFLTKAFSSDEQTRIMTTTISNPNNSQYDTNDGGRDTVDKVFLLSLDEVNTYFKSGVERKITGLQYDDGAWWLRTPGKNNVCAAYVDDDGEVEHNDDEVWLHMLVRPAMWIDISNF